MPSDFLIQFHQEHFSDTDVPIYSKEVFYKIIEELKITGQHVDKGGKGATVSSFPPTKNLNGEMNECERSL